MTITTYVEAADYLGRKVDRPLPGRATRVQRRDDATIAIRYQATDVVTYRADGTITLESGGWRTLTTKVRFNTYAPVRISSDKGTWYLGRPGKWADGPLSMYYDGMIIDADGRPAAPRFPDDADARAKRRVDHMVRTFIAGFAAHVEAGKLTRPNNGDCWGCLFRESGKPEGEPMGVGHYINHFNEQYFVPSLLMHALQVRAGNPGFVWQLIEARKDGATAAGYLRAFFRKLKPALVAEVRASL